MVRNYIITALRNLGKRKFYSLINISGLTVGMACCLLICFWVLDELSYDRYNTQIDKLYRVEVNFNLNGENTKTPLSPAPVAEALKNDFPEVQQV
ncbi:ABC transporter permease, partial [Cytophagales bacterium RKSG123]|nr:ABC transporter permease [Xanthovirga aplysinae]